MKQIKKVQLGKKGLTKEFIEQVKKLFESEKVVKVSILKSACRDKVEARRLSEELVESLGKKYNYKLIGYVITIIKFRKDQKI